MPAVGPAKTPPPVSGRFPAVGTVKPAEPKAEAPREGSADVSGTHSEADALFAQALERAAGEVADPQTAETLRRCLGLDPDLAAARYLLGMVLEQRGALAEAAEEYRKALRSLEEGRARATPFYLNNARLRVACERAIERVEKASGSSSPR
jgi:chemotaxis protein methyltransferase CheR